ncbi:SPRY domain-containing protein 3 [Cryptotermes secundus]|uniref:SPRY domain-containing protein 3 n=1 Tax=Cryptotermes secundus TaxID=105785 RepID=A0A2J7Q0V7_9NEOP|nr:SPRY domain-containing protein 3 [Cryptotermes secundus]
MLSCVSPHLFELLKRLFGTVHDTTMESLRNLQSYPVLRMKCSVSHDSDVTHERVALDGDFLSYAPDEDDRVGVYIAGHPLTPDTCYYETEIIDTGMDGSISIGLCSKRCPLDVHIGCVAESIGLMTDDGSLYREGSKGTQLCTRCECGDRIGCGIRFDQLTEGRGDAICMMVPVYFVRNGKELGTMLVSLPMGGLYPAVGMHSIGEEVRLFLGLNWVPEEDSLMSVDTNEEEWYRLSDIRLNGQDYPKHRHPGWNKGSIGYHADDGKIFIGSGVGAPFGPRCHKGDRMGCGILFPRDYVCQYDSDGGSIELSPSSQTEVDLLELSPDSSDSEDEDWWNNECAVEFSSKVKVFFTRNGKTVGMRQVHIPKGGFFPTIGMLSVQEKVRVDLRPLTG